MHMFVTVCFSTAAVTVYSFISVYVKDVNDANYNQTYLITSVEDVDSIISLIKKSWEDDLFSENFNPNFVDAKGERYKRHVAETFAVVDSLQNLKFKKLEPVFTFDADSVTIEHYAFAEFHGLGKSKTTLFFANRHHHHIKTPSLFYLNWITLI